MNLPNEIKGTFNRNIVLGVGNLRVFKDASLFLTFNQNDITVTDNYFTIDITNLFLDNGNYVINFDSGLFISTFGEVFEGINNSLDWNFQIVDGYYNQDFYNNNFYLTS